MLSAVTMTKPKPFSPEELELIKSTLQLDESSPSGLSWTTRVSNATRAGSKAGCLQVNRYGCKAWSVGLKGRYVKVHNVIWYLAYGEDPALRYPLTVDHINRDGSDNRLSNLRLETKLGQVKNRKKRAKPASATSKYTGVHWCNSTRRWVGRWTDPTTGRTASAYRKTEDEAHEVVLAALRDQDGGILQPCYATNQ